MEYKAIVSAIPDELSAAVTGLIANGWLIRGSIRVTALHQATSSGHQVTFTQVLTRSVHKGD